MADCSRPSITEPIYSREHTQLLSDMRALIALRMKEGYQPTSEFKAKLPMTQHWRDLYHQYRHLTRVTITPDPRLKADYIPPSSVPLWPDYELYRFLKAKHFSLIPATDMFLNALHFRLSFGMDDLAAQPTCPFHDFHSLFVAETLHSTDSEGNPLFLNFLGNSDPVAIAAYYPANFAYIIESYLMMSGQQAQQASSAALHRRITLFSVIIQCQGVSLAHRNAIYLLQPLLAIDDFIFPENMRQLIIINAPSFFTVLWTIVKTMIDKQTRAKFVILSPGDVAPVLERIGAQWTPKELGGECTKCQGPCVPSRTDWVEGWKALGRGTAEEVQGWEAEAKEERVTLAAKYEHVVTFDVRKTGTEKEEVTVWWSAVLAAKDIEFSLSFTALSDGAPTYHLVAPTRHEALAGPLRGSHHFILEEKEDSGVAKLTFSNSMSTFSGKEMTLRTGIRTLAIKE